MLSFPKNLQNNKIKWLKKFNRASTVSKYRNCQSPSHSMHVISQDELRISLFNRAILFMSFLRANDESSIIFSSWCIIAHIEFLPPLVHGWVMVIKSNIVYLMDTFQVYCIIQFVLRSRSVNSSVFESFINLHSFDRLWSFNSSSRFYSINNFYMVFIFHAKIDKRWRLRKV